jgi:malonyl-CoA O-methyltransferase
MNVLAAYAEWSHTYNDDCNPTRDLDEEVTRRIFTAERYQTILEIGCGTGKNTSLFARIADDVQAIDFSAEMIERARRLSFANITFTVADLTQHWPVDDSSINLISCNLVLEHIQHLSFIFTEAARVLTPGGQFFISELHPFRQYFGTRASFHRNQETHIIIDAFVHNVTDFIDAAQHNNLRLETIKEWRHEEDMGKPPRLISFLFQKP